MLYEHRKVNMLELFFDLVFVYAISNANHLIHHFSGSVIGLEEYFRYLVTFFVFISVWIAETLYLNRSEQHRMRDHVFLLIQMFWLMYLSNSASEDWGDIFVPYSIVLILLEVTNIVQYILKYREADNEQDKRVARSYALFMSIFPITLLIGIPFDWQTGAVINNVGLFLSVLLPVLRYKDFQDSTVHFPYLIERFGLLVIVTFGELIISIAGYFTLDGFDSMSLLLFLMIVFMFLYYVEFFDRQVEKQTRTFGLKLVYSHIPMILSLGTLTAAVRFLREQQIDARFLTRMLFGCIWGYYLSIFLNASYLRDGRKWEKSQRVASAGLLMIGTVCGLCFYQNANAVAMVAAALCALQLLGLKYSFGSSYWNGRNKTETTM